MLLDIFTALALAVDGYPALATDQSWDQMISFLNDPWLRVK